MKAYKLTVLVIDYDNLGGKGIASVLENQRYPNHCIGPEVKAIEERDIGEWSDEHPLNSYATSDAEFERLFPEKKTDA